ncbi:hypothetical protein SDRG_03136 [Saprolegnia diclina VS20]|uniref:FAST kinase leucine-rich domain-containing protein n=1 Tax=Saprolegnia diclina (strain VS20) TaxID=1156394 RepID=T0S3S4_SAPDV|nr:hypothetical protein SDRG_03136 [Saprolegnia diclina VS20]EQC39708.1 hypothetical protein SDRG_03136 [Saprolegnia diclina VS20]|eukprot:XP_008606980.1 hypothetical protein SDRG_03136 [Saprolegnia diclina VS20]
MLARRMIARLVPVASSALRSAGTSGRPCAALPPAPLAGRLGTRCLSSWSTTERRDNSQINAQLMAASTTHELLAIYERERTNFNSVNTATLFNKLGKAHRRHTMYSVRETSLLATALRNTVQDIAKFDLRTLSMIAHGVAKMQRGGDDGGFMDAVVDRVKKGLETAPAITVANLVWSAEKLGVRDRAFYHAIARHVRSQSLDSYSSLALANIAMGFAKARMSDRLCSVYATIDEALQERDLGTFEPQHLANIVWSFVAAERFDSELFRRVERHLAARGLQDFDANTLASLCISYAKHARHKVTPHPDLFALVSDHILDNERSSVGTFSLGSLVMLHWAFTRAKQYNAACTSLLRDELYRRGLDKCRNHEFVSLAWSLSNAQLPFATTPLYHLLEDHVVTRRGLATFQPLELSGLAFSFAKAGAKTTNARFFDALVAYVEAVGVKRFDDQGLANVAWSLYLGGATSPDVLDKMGDELAKREFDRFGPSAVAAFVAIFAAADRALPSDVCLHVHAHLATHFSRYRPRELVHVAAGLGLMGETVSPAVKESLVARITPDALTDVDCHRLHRWLRDQGDHDVPAFVRAASDQFASLSTADDANTDDGTDGGRRF